MPESGDRSRQPHSQASLNSPSQFRESAYDRAVASSSDRSAYPRSIKKSHRLNLWQQLFGSARKIGSAKKARGDGAATRLQVKQASFALAEPPDMLQSFRSNRKRVDAALGKTISPASRDLRLTAPKRSRQDTRLSARRRSTSRGNQVNPKQEQIPSSLRSSMRTTLQSQALTTFQTQPTARDQTEQLAQRRALRGRGGRSAAGQASSIAETDRSIAKSRPVAQSHQDARSRKRGASVALYAARMLILSLGIGVLAGTILSVWDPAHQPIATSRQTKPASLVTTNSPNPTAVGAQSPQGQEIAPLKAAIQALALQSPQVTPSVFFFDLDTNSYVDLNAGAAVPAASTIKVPILVAFFQDVDAGKIRLDELLTMQKELIAGGSGEMQGLPAGTQFTALQTITKMITISDNTATNMVIARLGGIAALNQRFRSWGLATTATNSLLPDLEGTNTTSSKEMALLMARISQGELVSMRSRDRMLEIMQQTVTDSLLPRGLGEGSTIAHKTGDIGGLVGDVGLIDLPNGKRYAAAVLVKRSFNDDRAQELIRQISRVTYQYFSRPPVVAAPSGAPVPAQPTSDTTTR